MNENNFSNQNSKKKKYWLIPIYVFIIIVVSTFMMLSPVFIHLIFKINVDGIIFKIIRFVFMFLASLASMAFLPSIICAIILSIQNKEN